MNFFKQKKWENFSGNVNIYKNLKESDIPKIINEPHIRALQFYEFKTPSISTWKVLNEFYRQNPEIQLHICWHDTVNFEFLKYIPSVRNFAVTSYHTKDFTPIRQYLDLEILSIGVTKSIATDLSFIAEFDNLEELYIDGMKKGLDSISQLIKLKSLILRGIKLDSLEIIRDLNHLEVLKLYFGSYKDLDAISAQTNLKKLGISRTRQIENYHFLDSLSNLEKLYFEGMSQMEKLPNLKGLSSLKFIQLDNNRRLTDISSMSELKCLETFLLFFPENFKVAWRKSLLEQSSNILMKSNTVKATNLLDSIDERVKLELVEKGIKWNKNQYFD